jgi:hypothetical protein
MTDLETRKVELEKELEEVNQGIAKSKTLQEISELHRLSDILNDLHQNKVLEKYDNDMCGRLYTMMEDVDKIIGDIENNTDIYLDS